MHSVNGRRIQELRESDGLTQGELGRKIGCSDVFVSYIETGQKQPSVDMLTRIANYFGVPIDDLVKRETA